MEGGIGLPATRAPGAQPVPAPAPAAPRAQAPERPDVSVVMPMYNCEGLLGHSLGTLLAQPHRSIEVIAVDDGSTDGTAEAAEAYASRDPRLRVLRRHHGGAGAARNAGLEAARGEFLMFLDADDVFDPRIVGAPLARIRETGADICAFGARNLDDRTGELSPRRSACRADRCPGPAFTPLENALYIFTFTTASSWNKLYRAEFVRERGLRFQELPNSNDLAFTFSANALAERIALLDVPLVSYRKHRAGSTQHGKASDPLAFYEALLALQSRLGREGLLGEFQVSFCDLALENCLFNLTTMMGDEAAAREVFALLKGGGLERLGVRGQPRECFPSCTKARYEKYLDLLANDFDGYVAAQRKRQRAKKNPVRKAARKAKKAVCKALCSIEHNSQTNLVRGMDGTTITK